MLLMVWPLMFRLSTSAAKAAILTREKGTVMRKYLVLPVLGVALLLGGLASSASAGSSTYYAGQNSQHQKLFFSIDQIGGKPNFDPFFTTLVIHCPATHNTITAGFSFSGFEIPLKNGKFHISLNDISDLFSWSGSVNSKSASGTESFQLAGFDGRGGLQDCASGNTAWKAQALTPGAAKRTNTSGSYHVTITKASNGSVHFSVTH